MIGVAEKSGRWLSRLAGQDHHGLRHGRGLVGNSSPRLLGVQKRRMI